MSTLKKIKSVTDLGLSRELIQEQVLKTLYVHGTQSGKAISKHLKIPFPVLEEELVYIKKRELVVVSGAVSGVGGYSSMEFELAQKGRVRVREIMAVRSYVGPLPVTIDDYTRVIDEKKIQTRNVTLKQVNQVFGDMVLSDKYFSKIGPAINSGGPILFFGEPGNGKTMIAEKIIYAFNDYIYVPHCLMVDGQFIKYFDPKVHEVISYDTEDPRWIKIKRPFIVVGGELTLEMLDLVYKDDFKYYEAPPQLKANGGVLLIDDFGRQRVSPEELLNRWIYPLEKKVDYLTLVTGKKIEVPFNQMLVFSSNLKPAKLGDDAFLRRIKYKVEILSPSLNEFREIFKNQCEIMNISYSDDGFNYLISKHYSKQKRDYRGCHSRDLLSHIQDYNTYYSKKNTLSKENIDFASESYFSKFIDE